MEEHTATEVESGQNRGTRGVYREGIVLSNITFEAGIDVAWLCPECHLLWPGCSVKKEFVWGWERKMD